MTISPSRNRADLALGAGAPDVLCARLFGPGVVIARDGRELSFDAAGQALLAFLLLHRDRLYSRRALAEILSADRSVDPDQPGPDTNRVFWQVRHTLEPDAATRGTYIMTTLSGEVGFSPHANCWLDVVEFELCAEAFLAKPLDRLTTKDAAGVEPSLQLYQDDLLIGQQGRWVEDERRRLRLLCIDTLAHVLHFACRSDDVALATTYGPKLLVMDPLLDGLHHDVMRLFARHGLNQLARRQFEHCRAALREHAGIEPMIEMQSLYASLVPGAAGTPGI